MQLASALGATCYTEDAFTAPGGTEEYAPPTPSCPGPRVWGWSRPASPISPPLASGPH